MSGHTWNDAVRAWRSAGVIRSAKWQRDELLFINWLNHRLDGRPLDSINPPAVETLRRELMGSGWAVKTINHYLSVLKAILRAAAACGWIPFAPRVKLLKVELRARWLREEQAAALLRALPRHLRDMAAFALETGLRKANVSGLRWEWLDFLRGVISIPGEAMKARRPYCAPLSPAALEILERWRGAHGEFVFVWRGARIAEPGGLAWRKALRGAGLDDFRWHDLRHTWASWLAQRGAPHSVIKELGGWSSDSMAARYAHLTVEHLRPWVQRQRVILLQRGAVSDPPARFFAQEGGYLDICENRGVHAAIIAPELGAGRP